MSSSRSFRASLFVPIVAGVAFLGGCGEEASKPSEFPNVQKNTAPSPAAVKAANKSLGRVGSDAGTPPER